MMKRKSTISSRCSRRAGLTLIEVIAALVILGTLLVGIVLSRSRHSRQIALAERKMQAVRAADGLLTRWWSSPEGIPLGNSGQVESDPSLRWRTEVRPDPTLEKLDVRVVRLEILETRSTGQAEGDEVLTRVELLLANPPEKAEDDPQGPPRQGQEPS
jgi:prepilin-type N-terminal cleavage/methylation domain-containing protein